MQLWDEDDEMINLPMMGKVEPFVTEGPGISMEDIFGETHPEVQQTAAAAPTGEREEVELGVITAEEVIDVRGQEEVRACS